MYPDYHTHHYRCGHATGNLLDYAQAAANIGLAEIGFSDHAPIYHLGNHPHAYPSTAMPTYELPNYMAEALEVKQAMQGIIEVRVGIESDYLPEFEAHYRKLWSEYPLDYCTGSAHWLGDWSIFAPYLPQGRTAESVLQQYLETTQALAKSRIYDVIAHFDCLKTAGLFTSPQLSKAMEKTIAVFAENGIVVEFNTSGWRKDIAEAYPSNRLLHICYDYGVGVTLGSDAHRPADVGYAFDDAVTTLRSVGYTELVTFNKRQKGTIPLDNPVAVNTCVERCG